jgi:hypothetical protein
MVAKLTGISNAPTKQGGHLGRGCCNRGSGTSQDSLSLEAAIARSEKYSQIKLQMKREALEKLNRSAGELARVPAERMCT